MVSSARFRPVGGRARGGDDGHGTSGIAGVAGVEDRGGAPGAVPGAVADPRGRCQGLHGAAADPRSGGGPRRRDRHRRWRRRFRLQLRPAGRRPGDVRLRARGRAAPPRRGCRRDRAPVGDAGLAWGVDGARWPGVAGARRARYRPLGWQGETGRFAAVAAARGASRERALLQHLRRLSDDPGGGGGRQRAGGARARRRRDQAEGRPPGRDDRPRPRRVCPAPRSATGCR